MYLKLKTILKKMIGEYTGGGQKNVEKNKKREIENTPENREFLIEKTKEEALRAVQQGGEEALKAYLQKNINMLVLGQYGGIEDVMFEVAGDFNFLDEICKANVNSFFLYQSMENYLK